MNKNIFRSIFVQLSLFLFIFGIAVCEKGNRWWVLFWPLGTFLLKIIPFQMDNCLSNKQLFLFVCFLFFCCACSEFITVNYVSLTAEGQFDSLNRIEIGLYLLFPIGFQNARSRCQRISLGFSLTEPRHGSHHEPHGPAATVAPSWHGKQWKLHTVTASTKWFIKQS